MRPILHEIKVMISFRVFTNFHRKVNQVGVEFFIMVRILPFRGLCYNLESVGDLSDVTAPPYDVISPDDQMRLMGRHPANIVRLILNPKSPEDTPVNNVYTRAAGYLHKWQESGILTPEAAPAFYTYTQTWEGVERKGLIGLLKLESFESGKVLPHERTLGGPKQDRLQLMKATLANLSQIFMIYADPERRIETRIYDANPTGWREATDPDQVLHRIKPLTDPSQVQTIQQLFEDQVLLIADGHHRYETALIYQQQVRDLLKAEAGIDPPDGALLSDYVMVFLTNMDDPGLKVFPTHRVLYRWPDSWSRERFETELFQKMETVGVDEDWHYWGQADAPPIPLKWRDEAALQSLPQELRELDVARLDSGVFQGMFGQTADQLKADGILGFCRDEDEVKQLMATGKAVAVFYVKAPPVSLVRQVSEAGHRMPQKSTYFYPKLLSGLALYSYAPFDQTHDQTHDHALSGVVPDALPLAPGLFKEQQEYHARTY